MPKEAKVLIDFFRVLWLTLFQIATVKVINYFRSREKKRTPRLVSLIMITISSGVRLAFQNTNFCYQVLLWGTFPNSPDILIKFVAILPNVIRS